MITVVIPVHNEEKAVLPSYSWGIYFISEKHLPYIYDICINVKVYLPISSRNNVEPRESPLTYLY